jgi:hypothetical protein
VSARTGCEGQPRRTKRHRVALALAQCARGLDARHAHAYTTGISHQSHRSRLAQARRIYIEHFGCSAVPPERDFSGPDLEAGTRIPGAALSGVHLRLPGHGDEGPTLEVFTYSALADSLTPQVNRPGYGHLAFQVRSVADAQRQVLAAAAVPWARSSRRRPLRARGSRGATSPTPSATFSNFSPGSLPPPAPNSELTFRPSLACQVSYRGFG